jgi:hypothetical protein
MHLVDTSSNPLTNPVSIADAARQTGLDVFTVLRLAEECVIPSEVRRVVDLDALRRHVAANPEESS